MTIDIRDRTAIVGIGQTAFAKGLGDTELSLACQAISMAIDDAGMSPSDIDGLSMFSMEEGREVEVARNLGLGDVTYFSEVGYGGGAGCGVVGHAAMAVATGQCRAAVAWRARKRASKASRPWSQVAQRIEGHWQWSRPFGLLRPVDEIAMLTRRYMHEFGATRDHLANVALAFRKHANRNPNATMREKTLSREQYMAARWISEPLCLFDYCLINDGGVALIITTPEHARDLKAPPVYIRGSALRTSFVGSMFPPEDFWHAPLADVAARAFGDAGLSREDMSALMIYDNFAPTVLFSLEGLGYCGVGEAGPFVAEGPLRLGGRYPTNTSGGHLSESYMQGWALNVEAVRQLRGTCGERQVEGAANIHYGCASPVCASIIYSRDPS